MKPQALIFYWLSVAIWSPMLGLQAQVSVNDSLALIAFNDSLDGANWTTMWDRSQPVDTWHGVKVDNGRVQQIVLRDRGLNGNIPNIWTSLSHLQKLDIRDNNVTYIPSFTGFYVLRTVIVNGNPLTSLPSLGDLVSLDTLWAIECMIDTLPSTANCLGLSEILFMDNGLKYVSSLAGNTALKKIVITGNPELTEINGLDSLVNLEELTIHKNAFNTLPNFGLLSNLKKLSFWGNNILVVPPLNALVNLEYLAASRNPLTSLPPLGNLNKLKEFHCDYTFIDSIPDLDSLTALEVLDVDGCRLVHLNGLQHCAILCSLSCELNLLTFLPDLTNLPLIYIRCGYNSLAFDDLEQFVGRTFMYHRFSPQRYFKLKADTIGNSLVLSVPFGGVGNEHDWYHGDSPIVKNVDTLFLPLGGNLFDDYRCIVSNTATILSDFSIVSFPFDPCTVHLDCDLNGDGRCDLNDLSVITSFYGTSGIAGSCGSLPPTWGSTLPNGYDVSYADVNFDAIISLADTLIILRDTLHSLDVEASLTATTGYELAATNIQVVPVSADTYKVYAEIVPLDTIPNVKSVIFGELINLPDGHKAIGGTQDVMSSVLKDTVNNVVIVMRFYFGGDKRLSTGLPSDKARLEVFISTLNDTAITLYPNSHISTCILTIDEQIGVFRQSSVYDDTVNLVMQSYGTVFYAGGGSAPLKTHVDTLKYILNPVLNIEDIDLGLEGFLQENQVELQVKPSYPIHGPLQILRGKKIRELAEIARLESKGNPSIDYKDTKPIIGTSYYQVIWENDDGESEASNIVTIRQEMKWERKLLTLSPNPISAANLQVLLSFLAKEGDEMRATLYDLRGNAVFHSSLKSLLGQNNWRIGPLHLPKGMYLLSLEWGGEYIETKRILVSGN